MKIWVDKFPTSCFDCPLFSHYCEFGCNLSDGCEDYYRDPNVGEINCPLLLFKGGEKA